RRPNGASTPLAPHAAGPRGPPSCPWGPPCSADVSGRLGIVSRFRRLDEKRAHGYALPSERRRWRRWRRMVKLAWLLVFSAGGCAAWQSTTSGLSSVKDTKGQVEGAKGDADSEKDKSKSEQDKTKSGKSGSGGGPGGDNDDNDRLHAKEG